MQTSNSQTADRREVLKIKNLRVSFHTYAGDVKALDGVELSVRKGELLGLVGESGCGKSVTTQAVAGLLPPNAEVLGGEVLLDGTELLVMDRDDMRHVRLKEIAIVFQDPMTYLNPVLTVGSQISEIMATEPKLFIAQLVRHRLDEIAKADAAGLDPNLQAEKARLSSAAHDLRLSKKEFNSLAHSYILSTLKSVRLQDAEKVMKMFPFELSGGMRQRIMIAMALVRRPKLLLADEMTTALDVTVQAQILQILRELKREIDASVLLITHDLAVVAEVCDRVAVMYAGNVIEVADVDELFRNPLHPYTKGLLASVPRVDGFSITGEASIKGSVPDLISPPSGCRFHPRCPRAFGRCPGEKPTLVEVSPGHTVSCFLYDA